MIILYEVRVYILNEDHLSDPNGHFRLNHSDDFVGKEIEEWRLDGKLHREGDLPAVIVRDPDTNAVLRQDWYRNGIEHRDGGPALIMHCDDGLTIWEWKECGEFHREGDLPAREFTEADGLVSMSAWFIRGIPHRVGKPQFIQRNERTGKMSYEKWHQRGEEHRADGPAEIFYDKDGKPELERYYLWGRPVSAAEIGCSGLDPTPSPEP